MQINYTGPTSGTGAEEAKREMKDKEGMDDEDEGENDAFVTLERVLAECGVTAVDLRGSSAENLMVMSRGTPLDEFYKVRPRRHPSCQRGKTSPRLELLIRA